MADDLVIKVIRLLEYEHGNFFGVRFYLDKAFSKIDYFSNKEDVKKAINNIDDRFYTAGKVSKKEIQEFLIIVVDNCRGDKKEET